MKSIDVLVAGEINPDLIISGGVEPAFGQVEKLVNDATLAVGSSSVIFACGAARLGLKTAFVGFYGDDLFGRFMLEQMAQRGINIEHVIYAPGQKAGLSVILNRGQDRAILTFPGLMQSLSEQDIDDNLLSSARHLHIASYFLQTALQPGLSKLFARAHRHGASTSLDTNYDPSEAWHGFDELLPLTDDLLPNEAEACSLTRKPSVEQAAAVLWGKVETLAIKMGASGALGTRGSEKIKVDSIPVEVVDTVGAGDSFDAGFIYGYLNQWSLEKTLKLAAVCGAVSTRAAGGIAAQATMKDVENYVIG